MIETENLRALLAEARRELARHVFTQESPACVNCGGESGFDVGRACPYADDYDLKQRIEAALAEPMDDMEASASRGWQMADSLHLSVKEQRERAEKAERERDEARAECVRLKKGWDEAHALSDWLRHEEMLRLEQLAFDRGAKAMREAAARKVLDSNPRVPLAFVAHDVRVMDGPEDKADDA
jgi:hypothetical protein